MRPTGLVVLGALTFVPPAFGHAFLERAQPPVGSEADSPPPRIVLTFTEGVEPLFSVVELRDPNGTVVPTDRPRTSPDDNRQLIVDLPVLAHGEYTVTWHVTSVDTHKTEGSFRFKVR
jgi:methionine-rich copper-binding protein CopC